jgi:transcriptional regulator with XRE-family HTH domain
MGWHIDQDREGQAAMPLAERIRQLRKEACLSHAEFADKIGADPGRVSRYEAGRLTPSAEALVRIAETLNVSIDHLLVDGIPRRPCTPPRTPSATASPPSPSCPQTTSPRS